MSEKNLPIKVVLQKQSDSIRNRGGGGNKLFGPFTPELQQEITNKFKDVLEYYKDFFDENELVPAVGKIIVKQDAIAKSHKPNDLCRKCPMIGNGDLNEIYIRISKDSIKETIDLIGSPPSKAFRANLTVVEDIQPIKAEDRISLNLQAYKDEEKYSDIKDKIKLKLFDFDDGYDNLQVEKYVLESLGELGLRDNLEVISYGKKIKYFKVKTNSYVDIEKIASLNGIKSIDFFQEYSLPLNNMDSTGITELLEKESPLVETTIGIIDGGISKSNTYLEPYVIAREEYVEESYQNSFHATFIASTIQYGNVLNNIQSEISNKFNFVDIVAIPNSDPNVGLTDTLGEEELMEIIVESMEKYASDTKIWNLSLGIESQVCDGSISDLAIFLDYIQDKYEVQFLVSSGNLRNRPLRSWPPQEEIGEKDRIISPADSIRAITVGSIAFYESDESVVKSYQPSPFSRRGPGASYVVKPDVVDFGGNCTSNFNVDGLGMKGLDPSGQIIEGIGTSYSTPRVAQKIATIYNEMIEKDLLLAKAMLVHSAKLNSKNLIDENQENIKYFGFGIPGENAGEILQCSEDEVTLVFKQTVPQGFYLEMFDFPFPKSLIRNGKYFGEIFMTLAYNPDLDERYGMEYCRTNIDVSFGTYRLVDNGSPDFKGEVPLESNWDEKFEKSRVENGFKWSPIKSYYRNISRGIDEKDGWKIRVDLNARNNVSVHNQEFVLIVTIKDPDGNDIYSDIVNGLRERGYITNDLETRQQVRQRL